MSIITIEEYDPGTTHAGTNDPKVGFAHRLYRLVMFCVEILFTLLLVLAFFSLFLWSLNSIFPTGTTLSQLLLNEKSGILHESSVEQVIRDLLFLRDDQVYNLDATGKLTAVLTNTRKSVKSKRADGIFWFKAKRGMKLFDSDAVQTFQRASASIEFDKHNVLQMGENSLVIIKRLEKDLLIREKRSFLVIVDGDLRGRIATTDDEQVHVEVTTPSAVARIHSRSIGDGQGNFKISVNPDKSSTITVYDGIAEIISQDKSVILSENQGITVALEGLLTDPIALPRQPVHTSPADKKVFYYRDLPPRIRFAWVTSGDSQKYRIVVARDPEFRQQVVEEPLTHAGFVHGNLRSGDYYWKVSTQKGEYEGDYSEPWHFRIVKDDVPPALKLQLPPETVFKRHYILTGQCEPGTRLYVSGKQVPVNADGTFQYPIKLKRGINVLVVEAVDAAGNVAYQSQLVNGKF